MITGASIIAAAGAGVPRLDLGVRELADIAPTAMTWCGTAPPADLDGNVIEPLLGRQVAFTSPGGKTSDPVLVRDRPDADLTDEEADLITRIISRISATLMADAASVRIGDSTIVLPELGRWAETWDELVAAAPLPTPFSRAWWLEHVSRYRPRYVLVVEGDELVGGIALEERVVTGISFVTMLGAGHLCPDHLDLVARPGYEDVVTAAVRTWISNTNARVMTLGGLVDGARWSARRSRTDRGSSRRPLLSSVSRAGRVPASRSKNFRANIRKAVHRADREGLRYRHLDPTEASSGLVRLRELHVARWGDSRFLACSIDSSGRLR